MKKTIMKCLNCSFTGAPNHVGVITIYDRIDHHSFCRNCGALKNRLSENDVVIMAGDCGDDWYGI